MRAKYRKETWSKNKDGTRVYKSPISELKSRVLPSVFSATSCNNAHSNHRRALKSAQEQEDWWRCRNERDRARHAAETAEQMQRSERLRKRRERDCARCTAQTANERQVTSQQGSTHECERMAAKTTEEKDQRLQRMNTSTKGWQLKPLKRENTQFCVNYSGTCRLFCYNMKVWCNLF